MIQAKISISDEDLLKILQDRLGLKSGYYVFEDAVWEDDCWGDQMQIDIDLDTVKAFNTIKTILEDKSNE